MRNMTCPKCGKDLGVPKSVLHPDEREWCLSCKPLSERPSDERKAEVAAHSARLVPWLDDLDD